MRRRAFYIFLPLAVCAAGIGLWRAIRTRAGTGTYPVTYLSSWSPQAAADYLDRREIWWHNWPPAQMDRGTVCISCHTVVPYAMVRPTLGQELHESGIPPPENALMDSIEKRVNHWSEIVPFYSNSPALTMGSHATEAVLNAVILASDDAQHGHLRPITRTALSEAWELQEETGENAGGWKWQDFNLAPWESAESPYQGAALLMLEVENAPNGYAGEPEIHYHLECLQEYLRRQYAVQPLVNQLYILWLSTKVPGLLTEYQKNTLMETIRKYQQADGGWVLASLDPQKRHGRDRWDRLKQRLIDMAKPAESDGYATGLVVLALEESGMSRQDQMVTRGLEWLARHQANDGSWQASSLNAHRDQHSNIGRFMSDAATPYAVMALENRRWPPAEK
jgi:squalene-hopene/tetraprenyl-beta-curcumene cyclase